MHQRLFCFLRRNYTSSSIKPIQLQNANEVSESREIKAIVQGIPAELISKRKAFIFRPARTAMQSGNAQTKQWQIQFPPDPKWENPLMGWTSSNDPVQGLLLNFDSKEAALNYVKALNLEYEIEEPNERLTKPKSYAENFVYYAGKLKIYRTK